MASICETLDEASCRRKSHLCDLTDSGCVPIASSRVMDRKRREQDEAIGGWLRIMLFLGILILVLFFALQQAFGIPVFDYITGENVDDNNKSTAAFFIVGGTVLTVLGALYVLLQRCDFSFACFLLGGDGGQAEQPVEQMKREKRLRDRLKSEFDRRGMLVTPTPTYSLSSADAERRVQMMDYYDNVGRDGGFGSGRRAGGGFGADSEPSERPTEPRLREYL